MGRDRTVPRMCVKWGVFARQKHYIKLWHAVVEKIARQRGSTLSSGTSTESTPPQDMSPEALWETFFGNVSRQQGDSLSGTASAEPKFTQEMQPAAIGQPSAQCGPIGSSRITSGQAPLDMLVPNRGSARVGSTEAVATGTTVTQDESTYVESSVTSPSLIPGTPALRLVSVGGGPGSEFRSALALLACVGIACTLGSYRLWAQ